MIKAANLTKIYGWTRALDDVSLTVEEGDSLGLVGESGAGKTTLAKILLGLIEPTSGTVAYQGIKNVRRECQIVFQDPQNSLNPRIRVGEAIAEPLLIHQLVERGKFALRVAELLELVGLPAAYADRYPHQLSGGERQRVGIARALATGPRLLVLDEPVSALDVIVQADILKLLKKLKKELQLTYLFITHDLQVIKYMCDRVAVMQRGRVIEISESETLFRSPQHSYTRELLTASIFSD